MNLEAWGQAAVGVVVVGALAYLACAAVTGLAFASYLRIPLIGALAVTLLAPLLGQLVLAVIALVKAARKEAAGGLVHGARDVLAWVGRPIATRGRLPRAALLTLGLLGLVVGLLAAPVVRLHAEAAFTTPVYLVSLPGGGAAVVVTCVFGAAVLVLALRRPSRLGAAVGVVIGSVWASSTAILLILSGPIAEVFTDVRRYAGSTIGVLAEHVLASQLGSAGGVLDGIQESITAGVGESPWFAVVGGVLLVVWSCIEVRVAGRAATAAARGTDGIPVASGPVVPAASEPVAPVASEPVAPVAGTDGAQPPQAYTW